MKSLMDLFLSLIHILRKLRQFSGLVDLPPTEFDVDNTIKDTADNGGVLKVRYKRPRENTVKVLLLMDSGGSMDYYSQLCSALFQAVSKSGHFKDLKVYYFHNCVYSRLYQDPMLMSRNSVCLLYTSPYPRGRYA